MRGALLSVVVGGLCWCVLPRITEAVVPEKHVREVWRHLESFGRVPGVSFEALVDKMRRSGGTAGGVSGEEQRIAQQEYKVTIENPISGSVLPGGLVNLTWRVWPACPPNGVMVTLLDENLILPNRLTDEVLVHECAASGWWTLNVQDFELEGESLDTFHKISMLLGFSDRHPSQHDAASSYAVVEDAVASDWVVFELAQSLAQSYSKGRLLGVSDVALVDRLQTGAFFLFPADGSVLPWTPEGLAVRLTSLNFLHGRNGLSLRVTALAPGLDYEDAVLQVGAGNRATAHLLPGHNCLQVDVVREETEALGIGESVCFVLAEPRVAATACRDTRVLLAKQHTRQVLVIESAGGGGGAAESLARACPSCASVLWTQWPGAGGAGNWEPRANMSMTLEGYSEVFGSKVREVPWGRVARLQRASLDMLLVTVSQGKGGEGTGNAGAGAGRVVEELDWLVKPFQGVGVVWRESGGAESLGGGWADGLGCADSGWADGVDTCPLFPCAIGPDGGGCWWWGTMYAKRIPKDLERGRGGSCERGGGCGTRGGHDRRGTDIVGARRAIDLDTADGGEDFRKAGGAGGSPAQDDAGGERGACDAAAARAEDGGSGGKESGTDRAQSGGESIPTGWGRDDGDDIGAGDWADMPNHIYVVHWAGAPARRRMLEEMLQRLGYPADNVTVMSWCDRRTVTNETLSKYIDFTVDCMQQRAVEVRPHVRAEVARRHASRPDIALKHLAGPKASFGAGHICNAVSHYDALADMVRRGYGSALVLEDDILLAKSFFQLLPAFVRQLDPDWGVLVLDAAASDNVWNHYSGHGPRRPVPTVYRRSEPIFMGSGALLWSHDAALSVASTMVPFCLPGDMEFRYHFMVHLVSVFFVSPGLAIQRSVLDIKNWPDEFVASTLDEERD